MGKEIYLSSGTRFERDDGVEIEVEENGKSTSRSMRSNLNLRSIGAGSRKGLDLEVLFQGLKKDVNLPIERGFLLR
jgi:hypothetical protein